MALLTVYCHKRSLHQMGKLSQEFRASSLRGLQQNSLWEVLQRTRRLDVRRRGGNALSKIKGKSVAESGVLCFKEMDQNPKEAKKTTGYLQVHQHLVFCW